MSDMKYCPSCGTSLSVTAAFCHNCGQKQKVETAEAPVTSEFNLEDTVPVPSASEPVAIESETAVEEVKDESQAQPEPPAPEVDPFSSLPVFDHPELKQGYQMPVVPPAAPSPSYPKAEQPMAPISTQPKAVTPPASPKPAPKKRFPWVFTVLWLIMTVAVGVWSYFVLLHPEYDFPVLTEDAQRYILLTAAIALIVYTLSLKLTMKKLKALPTVILVVASLVVFYFFCTVELTDGDWLHDTVTSITESILPASGD